MPRVTLPLRRRPGGGRALLLAPVLSGCLSVPTVQEAGVSYATAAAAWPADAACLNKARSPGVAKEVLVGRTRTVVIAGGPSPISDEAWRDFRPGLGKQKNSDRHLLFERSCFSRSPDRPASCRGADCATIERFGGHSWVALSQVVAADCLPDASACERMAARPGGLLVVVTRKCHELVFSGSVYLLTGPAGQRAVMHATADGKPTMDVKLPPGWSLRQEALAAPLVLHPFGGGDACYYNIIRDHRAQSYHQIAYPGPRYP